MNKLDKCAPGPVWQWYGQPESTISLRNWLAGQAIISMGSLQHSDGFGNYTLWPPKEIAVRAFRIADAMLAEGAKEPTP